MNYIPAEYVKVFWQGFYFGLGFLAVNLIFVLIILLVVVTLASLLALDPFPRRKITRSLVE